MANSTIQRVRQDYIPEYAIFNWRSYSSIASVLTANKSLFAESGIYFFPYVLQGGIYGIVMLVVTNESDLIYGSNQIYSGSPKHIYSFDKGDTWTVG